jgi:hypothetical protein
MAFLNAGDVILQRFLLGTPACLIGGAPRDDPHPRAGRFPWMSFRAATRIEASSTSLACPRRAHPLNTQLTYRDNCAVQAGYMDEMAKFIESE